MIVYCSLLRVELNGFLFVFAGILSFYVDVRTLNIHAIDKIMLTSIHILFMSILNLVFNPSSIFMGGNKSIFNGNRFLVWFKKITKV